MTNAAWGWQGLEESGHCSLQQLFERDPDRVQRLTVNEAGCRFDFSKTHLDRDLVTRFVALADRCDLPGQRQALFAGEPVNVTEGRAAEHSAERGMGAPDAVAEARALHQRMRTLVEAIGAGALGPIRHVLHIGIGGSALGPKLLIDALGHAGTMPEVHVLSNVDGVAFEDAVRGFDPAHTLVAIASKTFTTAETMLNAESALSWLREGGVSDPYGQVVALTASPDRAIEWGVDETRVLPFRDSVGGRHSLWSSIGFPAALALGWPAFEELLEGAARMDRHFRHAPLEANAPVLAAFVDLYYTQVRHAETRAVFAYDERLRLLPDYLQQLEMESNGKRVTAAGEPLTGAGAAITWGGVGTDAQHAVFQLLHQGTRLVPVEFVAAIQSGADQDPAHHRALLMNAFAQGAALMTGQSSEDPARAYPGDRPSTTILLDDVAPGPLGALIAFYEHRTFTVAAMLGINPFDQFGVELGKQIARSMESGEGGAPDPSTRALMRAAGLD